MKEAFEVPDRFMSSKRAFTGAVKWKVFYFGVVASVIFTPVYFFGLFGKPTEDSLALRFFASVAAFLVAYSSRFVTKLSLLRMCSVITAGTLVAASSWLAALNGFDGMNASVLMAFLFGAAFAVPVTVDFLGVVLLGVLSAAGATALGHDPGDLSSKVAPLNGASLAVFGVMTAFASLFNFLAFRQWKQEGEKLAHAEKLTDSFVSATKGLSQRLYKMKETKDFSEDVTIAAAKVAEIARQMRRLDEDMSEKVDVSLASTRSAQTLCDNLQVWEQKFGARAGDISETASSMRALVQNTQEIIEVTETIRSISQQIGLLSLNASIESARAGEYGRGFAVVAEEIGNLASISSDAVKGIEKKIAALREVADQCSEKVKTVTLFFDDLRGEVIGMDELSQEIKNCSKSQSLSSQEMSQFLGFQSQALLDAQSRLESVSSRAQSLTRMTSVLSGYADESLRKLSVQTKAHQAVLTHRGGSTVDEESGDHGTSLKSSTETKDEEELYQRSA